MSTTLLPTFPGRPPVVKREGGVIFVGVHDAQYLATAKAFKRALANAHPDRRPGKSSWRFRQLMGQREAWLDKEIKWYRSIGLEPPDGAKSKRQELREALIKGRGNGNGHGQP